MPQWLIETLEAGGQPKIVQKLSKTGGLIRVRSIHNEVRGLIPIIGMLCELDPSVSQVWLCHPKVRHVSKEGHVASGFCVYRNIQMLISYLQALGMDVFSDGTLPQRVPTVIQLQKWIESAWDAGINSHAREETGGILYTRKYIGTSEVGFNEEVAFSTITDCLFKGSSIIRDDGHPVLLPHSV